MMDEVLVTKPARLDFGGLWAKKTKSGITYLSGPYGIGANIEIWPNKKREGMEGANDPDYQIKLTERYKKPKDKVETRKDEISSVPF